MTRSFSLRRPVRRKRSLPQVRVTSLLWPNNHNEPRPAKAPEVAWLTDLGLDDVIQALTPDRRYAPFVRSTLATLSADVDVIGWRQAIFADFLANQDLTEQIEALLPRLADLRMGHRPLGQKRRNVLLETADRLSELDVYQNVVQDLHRSLAAAQPQSVGLQRLRDSLRDTIRDESFQALLEELPGLRAPLQHVASLTIGVNLDLQLQPISATLLAINEQPFVESMSLLDRLLGLRAATGDETSIAPLHFMTGDPEERRLSPLFQDLERLLTQIAQPVARALGRYVQISSAPLTGLENELAFFCAAADLVRRLMEKGVSFCRPEILPPDERISDVKGLVNIALTLRLPTVPVASDLTLRAEGRIGILTGPNSGGKTTFLQAVGLAHVMFHAGMFIPAMSARLSPIDHLLTHFPAQETRLQGRLAEEAERLRGIFQQASARSLVLLNESLSSTTPDEALYLARDVLCGLRAVGARGLFATHLIDLARQIPEMEARISGDSNLMSLVTSVQQTDGHVVPTFKIIPGEPLGYGYAQEIARRHGISLEQILAARRDAESPQQL